MSDPRDEAEMKGKQAAMLANAVRQRLIRGGQSTKLIVGANDFVMMFCLCVEEMDRLRTAIGGEKS